MHIRLLRFAAATAMLMGFLLTALSGGGGAWAGTITGNIVTPTGGAVPNGTLGFILSQPAVLSGTGTVVTTQVSCYTSTTGNVVGLPDPLTAATLGANTASGTLPAGTYYVRYSLWNASGESLASPETTVILSAMGTISIASPTLQPANASGYKVYISSTSGTETLQTTVTGFALYSQPTALVSGAALPVANTSVCSITFSDALVPTGTSYRVSLLSKVGTPVSGFPQTWCMYGGLSGTINISNGAPTGSCSTNGVFYPTPIFSTPPTGAGSQSISGTLNISANLNVGGNGVFTGSLNVGGSFFGTVGSFTGNLGVTGNQTVGGNSTVTGNSSTGGNSTVTGTQTIGGTLTGAAANFSGALTAKSVNSVLNAALYTGSDMTAKINTAIAALAGTCGTIIVPTGTYAVTTQLVKPKCVMIDLMGSQLNFGTAALPRVISGDAGTTTAFIAGGIRNGIINGNGAANTPIGIWLGGDSGAVNAPANYSDFLQIFTNLTVQNFASCYKVGYKAYQEMWIGGIIQQCTWGITHSNQYYSENMNLHGTQIINNTGNAIVVDSGSDFHCYGCSLDYNAGGAIQLQSGGISMHGGNIEQLSGLAVNSPASANGLVVGIYNTRLALTSAVGSDTSFLNIGGTNSMVTTHGVHLIHLHAVTEFVNWQSLGSQNAADLDFRDDNSSTILATQAAPNIQNLKTSSSFLGTNFNNLAFQLRPLTVATLPAAASFPYEMIAVGDSTAVAAEGQTCVGGSTNKAFAFSNGTVWKCF